MSWFHLEAYGSLEELFLNMTKPSKDRGDRMDPEQFVKDRNPMK